MIFSQEGTVLKFSDEKDLNKFKKKTIKFFTGFLEKEAIELTRLYKQIADTEQANKNGADDLQKRR